MIPCLAIIDQLAEVCPIGEMHIKDDAIAKRSYDYYSKLFSQPPLTEKEGIAVVLKFLAAQPAYPAVKNAKPEDFFDNSMLQELQREGFLARLK